MTVLKKGILTTLLLLFVVYGFSQEKIETERKLPTSIYTSAINFVDIDINMQLNLKSFKFITYNTNAARENRFIVSLESLGKKPSKGIYNSYKDVIHIKDYVSGYNLQRFLVAPKQTP